MELSYVEVKFDEGYKEYQFKTDLDLEVGDKVVCDTQYGYQVATVQSVLESSSKATKWIVDKVDTEAHEERLEKERKYRKVRAKLEKRRKELEDIHVYQILAEKDEEMAELVKDLTNLV